MKRTYEVLEQLEDGFYIANYINWFNSLSKDEKDQGTIKHLEKCKHICNEKLRQDSYGPLYKELFIK